MLIRMRGSASIDREAAGDRFLFIVPEPQKGATLLHAVKSGLSSKPKWLPSMYFYDDAGSHLFERITRLPEYYLTACELDILLSYADEILESAGERIEIVEFGSGSSRKTRALLEAALRRQESVKYSPIDISGEFLRAASLSLMQEFPRLKIEAIAAEYADGLDALGPRESARLALFMGSNIGNLRRQEAVAFLESVRVRMHSQDLLLIGADLVKDPAIIEAAYNDSAGVTESFNKNILARINTELQADFELDAFRHEAPYREEDSRVEMRLVSKRRQTARVGALAKDFEFESGEPVVTEICQKYTEASLSAIFGEAGWTVRRSWRDRKGWFVVSLLCQEK
jgi:L-histidine N-alpha-methyltransferase